MLRYFRVSIVALYINIYPSLLITVPVSASYTLDSSRTAFSSLCLHLLISPHYQPLTLDPSSASLIIFIASHLLDLLQHALPTSFSCSILFPPSPPAACSSHLLLQHALPTFSCSMLFPTPSLTSLANFHFLGLCLHALCFFSTSALDWCFDSDNRSF